MEAKRPEGRCGCEQEAKALKGSSMREVVEAGGRRLMTGRIYGLDPKAGKYVEILGEDANDADAVQVNLIGIRSGVVDVEGPQAVPVEQIGKKPIGVTEEERKTLRMILKDRVKRSRRASPFLLWGTPPELKR